MEEIREVLTARLSTEKQSLKRMLADHIATQVFGSDDAFLDACQSIIHHGAILCTVPGDIVIQAGQVDTITEKLAYLDVRSKFEF